jgi:hypothetical protein
MEIYQKMPLPIMIRRPKTNTSLPVRDVLTRFKKFNINPLNLQDTPDEEFSKIKKKLFSNFLCNSLLVARYFLLSLTLSDV